MFWGVTLETGKRYSQTVEESYHLTMAALEPPQNNKKTPSKYVSVMVEHDKSEYMLCTLEPNRTLQTHLDHMFVEGEQVTYFLSGEGTVHLTGYLVGEDPFDYPEDEEEDEESSEEEVETSLKAKPTKRKNEVLENSPEGGKKAKIDVKANKVNDKTSANNIGSKALAKKGEEKVDLKTAKNKGLKAIDESEDDSEDDEESDENEGNDSLGLIDNEAVEGDSDDDEDDEEEDEESDLSDDSGEEKSPVKPKQNQQIQNQNKNQAQKQNQKQNQNQQKPQNQFNQKSPQNQQQNRQNQFGSGQKGGQQKGFQQQKGQWNQSGNKNQNQKGGNQWQNKNQQNRQSFGGQNNSPNFGGKGGKQMPNFKGQQRQNFNQSPNSGQKDLNKEKQNVKQTKLSGGLVVQDLVEGHGPEANPGRYVHVNYIGRLPNNRVFDQTNNKPFSFRLGRGEVIKGWDIGLKGMKVGGKRKIIVPSNMGYGNRAVGSIPANSSLQFEVELKSVT